MKIVIWTGASWEKWGPGSLQTGTGGSEAAAVYLSRELARLGHEVRLRRHVGPARIMQAEGVADALAVASLGVDV